MIAYGVWIVVMYDVEPSSTNSFMEKSQNLKDHLVKAKLPYAVTSSKEPGTYQCKKNQCKMCNLVTNTNKFTSNQTKETFHNKQYANCTSNNIIYLITCKKCNMQYVGQTKHNLQTRFRNHRFNIIHNNNSDSIGNHFNLPNHTINDLSVSIIEQLHNSNLNFRLKRENYWIKKLKTLQPFGLNIKDEIMK